MVGMGGGESDGNEWSRVRLDGESVGGGDDIVPASVIGVIV